MLESLSNRTLNRTLLARQGLLEPWDCSPVEAIERLIGLQAQAPVAPYFGLFSRLNSFTPDQLADRLLDRSVVRVALMRSTLQLVSAADCLRLRPILQRDLMRMLPPALRNRADLAAIGDLAREQLDSRPRTFAELGPVLAARFSEVSPADLNRIARSLLALVQVPPRGIWQRGGPAAHATAEQWLGRPLAGSTEPDQLICRYLAAFGPATSADLAAWSGLTGLGAALRRLDPQLRCYANERGQRLYDVADGELAEAAVAVPVRIIAEFDNLLLGHADRSRIFDDQHRGRFMSVNGLVSSTLLVDGFVAGTCKLQLDRDRATLRIEAFAPLRRADQRSARQQAERLLRFAAPDSRQHDVVFTAAG